MRVLLMRGRRAWTGLSAGLVAGLALAVAITAHAGEPVVSTRDVKVLDVGLLDQQGAVRKFQTDVIGDRIAVVNFVYASCKTSCPMASAVFGQVQDRLGSRLGRDVAMVSLSIDPVTDRPAKLRAVADQFDSKPGWSWLTGEKAVMDQVLRGFGVYLSNITDHPTMVLIGDGKTGEWIRLLGFPSPDEIIRHVERFEQARRATGGLTAQSAAALGGPQQGAE